MNQKFALMGDHIHPAKMPKLQLHLAELAGIDISYGRIDGGVIENLNPKEKIEELISQGYSGINVTHPYKQQVWHLVDEPVVLGHDKIGSYNTLKFKDGKIFGGNTDYSGFIQGYQHIMKDEPPGEVLLCGAGGVGRAIAFALCELGASKLFVADLVTEQANNLCQDLNNLGYNVAPIAVNKVSEVMGQVDGLVNCTALGMFNKPGSAFNLNKIESQKWAFDAVYTPLHTSFMTQCIEQGLTCMTGFDLWIFQGIDAFKIFNNIDTPVDDELMTTTLSWLD